MMETLPLALPAVVGANFAVNDALELGPSVCGIVSPLMLKPVPEALAWEIVTPAAPEFVRVTETEALAPVTTLPKLTLAGEAES